ncbi:hypothetical protein F8S13_17080 [Chloroflexia bacterium SDU3-3]|nr:hypothetical protein F8S13_17080 [Chloroflexia bacterium SDU3-3]
MRHRIAIILLPLACALAACGASATGASAPTEQPTAIPTATPVPKGGKWDVSNDTSSFDDSPLVTLMLNSEEQFTNGLGKEIQPVLILRCKERYTEAYIVTGVPPDVESGNLDHASVRIRLDQQKAELINMGQSTDGKGLFFPDAAIIDRMAKHERLLFSFTPFQQSPTEMSFDLRGLPDVLPQLRAACKK